MKKGYLILLLASISSFAVTGEFNFNFTPEVNVNKDKTTTHKYVLPYKLDLNFDEQNVFLGIDGKYNNETPLGLFEFLKNEVNIWGKYRFTGDIHSGYIRIDNEIKTAYTNKFNGSLATTLSGGYKYKINDKLTYDLNLAYKGDTLIASPAYIEAKNKLTIDGGYQAYINLKQNFKGSLPIFDKTGYAFLVENKGKKEFTSDDEKFTSNTIVKFGGSISKQGFTFKPSYELDIVFGQGFVAKEEIIDKDTVDTKLSDVSETKGTYSKNTIDLNLGYNKNFEVLELNAELNNKLSFAVLNGQMVNTELEKATENQKLKDESYKLIYTFNPKLEISKKFDKSVVSATPKLSLEGKTEVAVGNKYNYVKSASFSISPKLDLSVQIVEGIKFVSNIDLGFNFKQNKLYKIGGDKKNDFSFNDFSMKLSLGLKYNW